MSSLSDSENDIHYESTLDHQSTASPPSSSQPASAQGEKRDEPPFFSPSPMTDESGTVSLKGHSLLIDNQTKSTLVSPEAESLPPLREESDNISALGQHQDKDVPQIVNSDERPVIPLTVAADVPINPNDAGLKTFEEIVEMKLREEEERLIREGKADLARQIREHEIDNNQTLSSPNKQSPGLHPSDSRGEHQFETVSSYAAALDLQKCSYCTRSFAKDRLAKHEEICKQNHLNEQFRKKTQEINRRKKEGEEKLRPTDSSRISPSKIASSTSPQKSRNVISEMQAIAQKEGDISTGRDGSVSQRGPMKRRKPGTMSEERLPRRIVETSEDAGELEDGVVSFPPLELEDDHDESQLRDMIALRLKMMNLMGTENKTSDSVTSSPEAAQREPASTPPSIPSLPTIPPLPLNRESSKQSRGKVLRRPTTANSSRGADEQPPRRVLSRASSGRAKQGDTAQAKPKPSSKQKGRSTSPKSLIPRLIPPRPARAEPAKEQKPTCKSCSRPLCCSDAAFCCRCGAHV